MIRSIRLTKHPKSNKKKKNFSNVMLINNVSVVCESLWTVYVMSR